MKNSGRIFGARRGAWVGGLLVLAASSSVPAQDRPDGIPLGSWVFKPAFSIDYEADDNVFRRDDQDDDDDREDEDRVTTFTGELSALLPFRNSELRFDYEVEKLDYQDNDFERDLAQDLSVELELEFRTGDVLTLSDDYSRDFARIEEIDEGGETIFEGEPFNSNRWEVSLRRQIPRKQGYLMRVRRTDAIFDGDSEVGFYNYRGFDTQFEYKQPLPGGGHWNIGYTSRRYNHYDPNEQVAPKGIPFRREESDNVTVGFTGMLGEDQPIQLRIGFGRFQYDNDPSSLFEGVVGQANWRVRLGDDTDLRLQVARRPTASSFDTYYVRTTTGAELSHEWRRFEAGVDVDLGFSDYADPLPRTLPNGQEVFEGREDFNYSVEIYTTFELHDLVEFEFATSYSRRNSTFEGSDYERVSTEASMSFGW